MTTALTPDNARTFGGLKIISPGAAEVGTCMLFYGAGGSAKTTVMSQIVEHPDGGPMALLDIDGSSSSVYHLIPKGLDIIPIPDWRSFMSVVRDFAKPGCEYKSIGVDNLSELASMCMRNITTEPTPQIQHWGQMTAEMLRVVRMLRDVSRFRGANVLFSAWEEVGKDEEAGYVRRTLNLTPKFAAALPGIVTMVGHLGTVNNPPDYTRVLTFAPNPKLDSKWRVAPTERAAKIPQILYLRPGTNFLFDYLMTVRHGEAFPVDKYAAPQRRSS